MSGRTTLLNGSEEPKLRAELPDQNRPKALKRARKGKPDDLTRINGVSPRIQQQLHELGIFHYEQIAGWTPENAEWVDTYLNFAGRIPREGWVAQRQRARSDLRGWTPPVRRIVWNRRAARWSRRDGEVTDRFVSA